jgi:hypothetical protein
MASDGKTVELRRGDGCRVVRAYVERVVRGPETVVFTQAELRAEGYFGPLSRSLASIMRGDAADPRVASETTSNLEQGK